MEPSGNLSEAMDIEGPLTVEAPDMAGKLPLSLVLRGGPATVSGVEVKRSGPEVVTVGSDPRAITTDSKVVALKSASMGSDSEGLQAHQRDFMGIFATSEYA
ncbi:hypothetical protein GUJ93_ZPchr0006g43814 [Zizania palustris]|uniref:Uncharacterized protein n=1 Tax=Zizania palustris TaxID=103762 RepID=A0A8J5T2X6_ZIZPA|nr:hypothetical protein GUJ93_ZPchr0006g43814 [Zizania palustris]